uniref:Uncharacterized protein n=1 Tax=viral metagenome TaxID=1070528 RepID=A0A6C0ERR9_9ZZZZ
MSVNYFLYSKSQHKKIVNCLEEIKTIYEDIIQHTINENDNLDKYNKDADIELLTNLKDSYISKIIEGNKFCEILTFFAHQVCQHNFVKDTIDITPDRCQEIIYCTICEYTK